MGFFKRLLGICSTQLPVNASCFVLEEGTLVVDLEKATELSEPGGALRLEGDTLPVRVLVVHTPDNGYVAFQNKCTHGGRRLDHKPDEQVVECCSVGQSRFDYSGDLKGGSAKQSIKTYPVEASDRQLRIQLDHP